MMQDRQFVTPIMVRNGEAKPLTRIPFDERMFKESWLQELLYAHPEMIPVGDIEPVFEGLQPLAREVPTGSGSLDLLYMNSKGYLTLVETKLWRNPEARRTVVAQIIDYAKRMASWTYEDLQQAVLNSRERVEGDDPLVDVAREDEEDFDEREFIDRVNRNLRLGRFVLLIVGDGIHEGVEQMADFLNQTPQLQFRLGLIEMGIFRAEKSGKQNEFFVQPRLLARTREVVRAVVEIRTAVQPSNISVSVPSEGEKANGRRGAITQEEFLEELANAHNVSPNTVAFARWVLDEAPSHQLEIKWGDAGPLLQYVDQESGTYFTFGQLNRNGLLTHTGRLCSRFRKMGLPSEIYQDYMDKLAGLIPGAERRSFRSSSGRSEWEQVAVSNSAAKGSPPLSALVDQGQEWMLIIEEAIGRIQEALAEQEAN